MGSTAWGDLPSGAVDGAIIAQASLASNGAAASYGNIGALNWRAPQDITIVDAWWEPTSGNTLPAGSGSYRRLSLIDAGLDGLGTRVLASFNLTATQASNTQKVMTLIAAPTVAKNHVVAFAIGATVGGNDANQTEIAAGNCRTTYRPI